MESKNKVKKQGQSLVIRKKSLDDMVCVSRSNLACK
jgi:hypothetical protein